MFASQPTSPGIPPTSPTSPTSPNSATAAEIHGSSSKRIVLCFDGTGNKFNANPSDTNIVKLYNMMDRGNPDQMHYYQPGIGTYPAEGPVNVGYFRAKRRELDAVIDEMFATTFDDHVIAGYRFIMRYYRTGDRIYIFGFSRGSFTARFLARMISHIGLLSVGNDEMVPFAYKVYQDYEKKRSDPSQVKASADYMNAFKRYFCRTERQRALDAGSEISDNESGVKVHFLGLFDCVGSVGTLDLPLFKKTPPLPAVCGTAEHIRHAVAIDERRVKFKAALFSQEQAETKEDIKEVWFPGNHCDIGGGWMDVTRSKSGNGVVTNNDDDYFQLSDISLKWMIDEIDEVEEKLAQKNQSIRPYVKFSWDIDEKASFLKRFQRNADVVVSARLHDTMTWNGGTTSKPKIVMWKLMEYLPFIKRWEFVQEAHQRDKYRWDYIAFPLNRGGCRDIPSQALFHHAVLERMLLPASTASRYAPKNRVWVKKGDGLDRTQLSDVANQLREESKLHDIEKHGDRSHSSAQPHFIHDKKRTTGSAEVAGEVGQGVTAGPTKWDRVYRLDWTPETL